MEEPADKIILFESYDNVINANIAKTKLDAYGIPCFLTGEQFTNVYPLRNELFPGVRLFIFEKDLEIAKGIMVEEPAPENEVIRCPHCSSINVVYEEERGTWYGGVAMLILSLLMVFPLTAPKKSYHCRDCDRYFKL